MLYNVVVSIVIYKHKLEDIQKLLDELIHIEMIMIVIVDNSHFNNFKNELSKYHTIDYIHNPKNTGYGSANNIALYKYEKMAKYFLVMNPDIEITKDAFIKIIQYAENKKEFGILTGKIIYPNGENQFLCRQLPTPFDLFLRRFLFFAKKYIQKHNYTHEMHKYYQKNEFQVPFISGCFMFCHYENLLKENGFDERYFMYMEDVDLSRRMMKYGNFCKPSIEIIHRLEKASFKSWKMTKIHIQSAIKYFNKWGWFNNK